jgi:hypothetical protein
MQVGNRPKLFYPPLAYYCEGWPLRAYPIHIGRGEEYDPPLGHNSYLYVESFHSASTITISIYILKLAFSKAIVTNWPKNPLHSLVLMVSFQ